MIGYRKACVLAGMNWISFLNGFIIGQVTGLIDSLQKKDDGIDLTEGQVSLIATLLTAPSFIGIALIAVISDKLGRRWPCTIFSLVMLINWIILYNSNEMYQFILSRVIGSISLGAFSVLVIFVTSEYTSSDTRAFYLNMVTTATPGFGTSAAHAVGILFHWKTLALMGAVLSSFGIIFPYFWVESPHWLASKGRFEECETAFRLLHGNKLKSKRELKQLVKVERSKLEKANEMNNKTTLKKLCVAFNKKYYWGLIFFSFVLSSYFTAAGKHLFNTLATVILGDITSSSDILLFTLLVDSFIVIGSCLSCFLIKKLSMRNLLFTTGFAANVILVFFSICYYLKNGQTYFNWINIALLGFYFIVVNAGPCPVVEAIISEMFPLELKMYTFIITGIMLAGFNGLAIFLYPFIVASTGYHGLFLTNAVIMSLCLGYIWLKLPETKGKTLQEIESYFKTNNFDIDEVLSNDQTKSLI